MPKVYKWLQSSFVSLAWPWWCRSLPQWEPVGVLGPWTGAQCGWVPSSPATNYLTNPKSDRLTFFHMAGWLANCSWLPECLSNKMSTWPSPLVETSCGQVCYYFTQGDLWSDVPPGRDILWPSVILHQVRLICLWECKSCVSSHSNSGSISIY